MKEITAGMTQHIEQGTTALCTCWRIALKAYDNALQRDFGELDTVWPDYKDEGLWSDAAEDEFKNCFIQLPTGTVIPGDNAWREKSFASWKVAVQPGQFIEYGGRKAIITPISTAKAELRCIIKLAYFNAAGTYLGDSTAVATTLTYDSILKLYQYQEEVPNTVGGGIPAYCSVIVGAAVRAASAYTLSVDMAKAYFDSMYCRVSPIYTFTDHDNDLVIDGLTYRAKSGYKRSEITTQSNFAVDNLDIDGFLTGSGITADDLRAGRFNFARIWIFTVAWDDLTLGKVKIRKGWFGEVTLKGNLYTVEMRGLMQSFNRDLCEVYTPECRADLGDKRCGVDLAGYRQQGVVSSVTNRKLFVLTGAYSGPSYAMQDPTPPPPVLTPDLFNSANTKPDTDGDSNVDSSYMWEAQTDLWAVVSLVNSKGHTVAGQSAHVTAPQKGVIWVEPYRTEIPSWMWELPSELHPTGYRLYVAAKSTGSTPVGSEYVFHPAMWPRYDKYIVNHTDAHIFMYWDGAKDIYYRWCLGTDQAGRDEFFNQDEWDVRTASGWEDWGPSGKTASYRDAHLTDVISLDTRVRIDYPAIGEWVDSMTANGGNSAAFAPWKEDTSGMSIAGASTYLNCGLITFKSGKNKGLSMEIKSFDNETKVCELYLPMPFEVAAGDLFEVVPGCPKTPQACKAYRNILNFRGEPFVPGNDEVMKVATLW